VYTIALAVMCLKGKCVFKASDFMW